MSTIASAAAVVIEHSPTIEPTEMSMVPPTRRTVIIIASRPSRVTELTMFSRFRVRKKTSPLSEPKTAMRMIRATNRPKCSP